MAAQPRLTFTLLASECAARSRAVAMATPLLLRLMFIDNNGNVMFLLLVFFYKCMILVYCAEVHGRGR